MTIKANNAYRKHTHRKTRAKRTATKKARYPMAGRGLVNTLKKLASPVTSRYTNWKIKRAVANFQKKYPTGKIELSQSESTHKIVDYLLINKDVPSTPGSRPSIFNSKADIIKHFNKPESKTWPLVDVINAIYDNRHAYINNLFSRGLLALLYHDDKGKVTIYYLSGSGRDQKQEFMRLSSVLDDDLFKIKIMVYIYIQDPKEKVDIKSTTGHSTTSLTPATQPPEYAQPVNALQQHKVDYMNIYKSSERTEYDKPQKRKHNTATNYLNISSASGYIDPNTLAVDPEEPIYAKVPPG